MASLDTAPVVAEPPPARAPVASSLREQQPEPSEPQSAAPRSRSAAPQPPLAAGPHRAVTIPAAALRSLNGFREWTRSAEYPSFGRIELIGGDLFVDMTVERYDAHNAPKTEIARVLGNLAVAGGLGEVVSDGMRYALPDATTSFEPDVSFISIGTAKSGCFERVPTQDGEDTIEFAGAPDVVVEVVSPSSERKDAVRLPVECFTGGVTEYWLVDCRGEDLTLRIHRRGAEAFEPVPPDADNFSASSVFGRKFRLTRAAGLVSDWRYRLEER